MNIEEHPIIALVVDRKSGRVIDSERYTYGPYLTDLVARHDLTQFDVILRAAIETRQPEVAPPTDYEPGESEFSSIEREAPIEPHANADDDTPF